MTSNPVHRSLHLARGRLARVSIAAMALSVFATSAHALFDDDEARRRIDNLKSQVEISQRGDRISGRLTGGATTQQRRHTGGHQRYRPLSGGKRLTGSL